MNFDTLLELVYSWPFYEVIFDYLFLSVYIMCVVNPQRCDTNRFGRLRNWGRSESWSTTRRKTGDKIIENNVQLCVKSIVHPQQATGNAVILRPFFFSFFLSFFNIDDNVFLQKKNTIKTTSQTETVCLKMVRKTLNQIIRFLLLHEGTMGDSMVTLISLFSVLLYFKCCGPHTSGTSYFYLCLNIAYIQGFNLTVIKFFCVSICDRGASANLSYSHYVRNDFVLIHPSQYAGANKHTYYVYTIPSTDFTTTNWRSNSQLNDKKKNVDYSHYDLSDPKNNSLRDDKIHKEKISHIALLSIRSLKIDPLFDNFNQKMDKNQ